MYSGQSGFTFFSSISLYTACTALPRSGDLPLAFLLTFCRSLGFYSASRWCGPPRLSSSQLLPVWIGSKVSKAWSSSSAGLSRKCQCIGLFPLSLSVSRCSSHTHTEKFLRASTIPFSFYLECAPSTSRRAEHVAFLPHALDAPYVVGDQGQIGRSGARGSRLLVLSLLRQSGGFKLVNGRDGCSHQSSDTSLD